MTDTTPPLVDIVAVRKVYQAAEPLHIQRLTVTDSDRVVLGGLDQDAAELLIHLITGAVLPDEGQVRVAGRDTRDIGTDTEWLTSLDRFGIVTDRAVLLDGLSIAANLALPITVAIDPLSDETRHRVDALAAEVGVPSARLDARVSSLESDERVRVHLARALAADPALLLLEHPTRRVEDRAASRAFGRILRAVADVRDLGWVAITDDDVFADASGGRRLWLDRGAWQPDTVWRRLWRRR